MIGRVVGHEARLTLAVIDSDEDRRDVEAVLDTGFNGALTLPREIVSLLRLPVAGRRRVMLADGTSLVLPLYVTTVDWNGERREVLALSTGSEALVGMSLLDGHRVVMHVVEGGAVTIDPWP